MADTADRRSEGKTKRIDLLKRRQYFKSLGICYQCEKNPVQNRSYCYQCSEKQVQYTRVSAVRRVLKDEGLRGRELELMTIRNTPGLSPEQKELLLDLAAFMSL